MTRPPTIFPPLPHQCFNLMDAKKAAGKWADYEMGPKVAAHLARMRALPGVADMLASGIPVLPAQYL